MADKFDYTEAKAKKILDKLAKGMTLNKICQADDMPDRHTVINWTRHFPEFYKKYCQARNDGIDAMAEEIIDIADDSGLDIKQDENGKWVVDGEAVSRARVRVDTRKWYACKLAPKKYGDRIIHENADLTEEMLNAARQRAFERNSDE